MRVGQEVSFIVKDELLGDFACKGVPAQNIYGRLWRIKPHRHKRLSGKTLTIHEDGITPVRCRALQEQTDTGGRQ